MNAESNMRDAKITLAKDNITLDNSSSNVMKQSYTSSGTFTRGGEVSSI